MKRFACALIGASVIAAVCLTLAVTGCDKKDDAGPTTSTPSTGTLTVGFIYVGTKDDYGYNQAHHEGAEVVKKMSGVKVIEQESVLETTVVADAMDSMINN